MSALDISTSVVTASAPCNPFSTAALAMQAQPPKATARMASLAICAMVALAALFATFARVDIVVTLQGTVIPHGRSKVVQSTESGVVRVISVKDGQSVKAGDVLLELDATNTEADRLRVLREVWQAEGDVLRALALLAGKDHLTVPANHAAVAAIPAEMIRTQRTLLQSQWHEQHARLAVLDAEIATRQAECDAIAAQLQQIASSLPLVAQKGAMREALAKSGHMAQNAVLESRLELINAQKEQSTQSARLNASRAHYQVAVAQRAQLVAEFRSRASTAWHEALKRRDVGRQELIKVRQRRALQTLRSPIDGVVQQLAVSTVGGVVTAAQPLLTVVPVTSSLEIEAQVMNRDVGHLKPGQRVMNKLETFDFTHYGAIEGEVQWVGTDAVADQQLGSVYPVRIRMAQLQTPNAVRGAHGQVTAGMRVSADVRTGERRLIAYLLAPLLRYKQEALRER